MAEESDRFIIGGKRDMSLYEETKKEFEKIIIAPTITIKIELPENFKNLEEEFSQLEKDEKFLKAALKLAIRHLKKNQEKKSRNTSVG
jgi:hypothetical protein